MKVLLLNLWRVINSKGGTEKVFFAMANAMVDKGYEIVALALENKQGKPFFPVDDRVKFINVGLGYKKKINLVQKLHRLTFITKKGRHNFCEQKVYDPPRAVRIKPILDREEPDVIVSYNVEATRILYHNLKVKIPVITMFHFDPDTILRGITEGTKAALEATYCIQVLLPGDIAKVKKYLSPKKIINIANVVPLFPVTNICKENIIIAVGRLDKNQKRQHLLIEAFNKIREKCPEWVVAFWGETDIDTKYYKYCCSLIKKYKLEEQIKFYGTTDAIYDQLQKAAIFAQPSAYEGFPLAMTEAMSAGLPVIGYKNCPAVNELVRNGQNGFLCADGTDDYADKLLKLVQDRELREKMGKQAKQDMQAYGAEKIWGQWEDLLESITE